MYYSDYAADELVIDMENKKSIDIITVILFLISLAIVLTLVVLCMSYLMNPTYQYASGPITSMKTDNNMFWQIDEIGLGGQTDRIFRNDLSANLKIGQTCNLTEEKQFLPVIYHLSLVSCSG